ncbi:hypothetical protein SAMN05443575_1471 [Jatrophihabitans endophyticus]|uniref:Uncharacterized protein n=1 Tax=Jatrophihabitans endophyticus TaxID=1206085 RepID=A0A1M5HCN5_9ACTN|nr:hypothetical protein [Jatrophihabitans endophyticus]SHG13562.1 hypothetical protein SAMN05443575_1471 [Jatrophihabitans endophyticus]
MKTIRTLAVSALLACLALLTLGGFPAFASPLHHSKPLPRHYSYCGKWGVLWKSKTKHLDTAEGRNCFTVATERNGSATLTARMQVKVKGGHAEKLSILAEWAANNAKSHKTGDNGNGVRRTVYATRSKHTRVFTYQLGTMHNVVHKGDGDVYAYLLTDQSGTKGWYYGLDANHSYAVSSKRR